MDPATPTLAPEQTEEHLHWRALSDPTRRRILDLLRFGPRTTGSVAEEFPISRIAVMRHLDVLAEAGLLTSTKRGRERWHYVNLAPLMELHKRWSTPLGEQLGAGMIQLRDVVAETDESEQSMTAEVSSIDISMQVEIGARRGAIFEAITNTPGAWWGHPFLRPDAVGLSLRPELGAHLVESWENGAMVMATVTGITTDTWIQLTGPFHLGVANVVAEFDIVEQDAGSLVSLKFRGSGLLDPDMVEAFNGAWRELIAVRLKRFAEEGVRLGIEPG